MHFITKFLVNSFLLIFFTIGTVSICKSETIDALVQREGLFYLKFTDVPFNGELEGIQQGLISKGKKQGQWLEFWVTGQLKSRGEYDDGRKNGPWLLFYTNGQLLGKGNYLEDKEDGEWQFYFRDGTINNEKSGNYKEGNKSVPG